MPDIGLRIQRLDQLFDNLDPAPFHTKALDRNAEAYLLESAGEYGARQPLSIAIHAPAALDEHLADITSAIHTHFSLAHRQAERRHRHRRRIGRVALSAGVATLAIALLLRRWVEAIGGSIGEVMGLGGVMAANRDHRLRFMGKPRGAAPAGQTVGGAGSFRVHGKQRRWTWFRLAGPQGAYVVVGGAREAPSLRRRAFRPDLQAANPMIEKCSGLKPLLRKHSHGFKHLRAGSISKHWIVSRR